MSATAQRLEFSPVQPDGMGRALVLALLGLLARKAAMPRQA